MRDSCSAATASSVTLQVTSYCRYGVLAVEERDRVLELAAEVAQLERGQRVEGVFQRVYCWGLPCGRGRHRELFLTVSSWRRDLAIQRARPVEESAVVSRLLTSIELR
jgi:hypothetical protein